MTNKSLFILIVAFTVLSVAACDPKAGNNANKAVTNTAQQPFALLTGNKGHSGGAPVNTAEDRIVGDSTVKQPAVTPSAVEGEGKATTSRIGETGIDSPVDTTVVPHAQKDLPPVQGGLACGEAYRDNLALWAPGLPAEPSPVQIFTDIEPKTPALRYTDARQDAIFSIAADRANALPAEMQNSSRDFARKIRDVRVFADQGRTGAVKVKVVYQHRMQKAAVELRGQLTGRGTDVRLVQVPVPGQSVSDQAFSGVLTCADLDHGCKNIILRLDSHGSKTHKIVRSVFIVHRWGEAHITMSEEERRKFATIPNQSHTALAEYLSNTANNACLNLLAQAQQDPGVFPECKIQRLQAECANEDIKQPAARSFGLRSWAVVYGRAGFELDLASKLYNGVADYDVRHDDYLSVRGPLAFSAAPAGQPIYKHSLVTSGRASGIDGVYLIANDGGGNLNLRFDFTGQPEDHMRVSVSSLLPNTLYSKSTEETARQMPQLNRDDI